MSTTNENYETLENGKVRFRGKEYKLYAGPLLEGPRVVIRQSDPAFPAQLAAIPYPPKKLYCIGDASCLDDGLAIIGARKATPYGLSCAFHFAERAAEKGITVVSGGAFGCDSQAHRGALAANGRTVAFLGGGCDQIYPSTNYRLFQDIIDSGGAVVSEQPWNYPALPYTFRMRNRLIAGCSRALLIVEAGLPSGTFSTADDALCANRDVLVVPSAITSPTSAGSNRLLYQGATPIVDDETFEDTMFGLFGILKQDCGHAQVHTVDNDPLLEALLAQPMRMDDILAQVHVPRSKGSAVAWLTKHLVDLEMSGHIAKYPDGRYGPARL